MRIFIRFIILLLIFTVSEVKSQNRWVKVYHDEKDAYGNNFINSYDKGYIISGKHGRNYVTYNWLIKTDINGDILWEKTIGNAQSHIKISDMAYCSNGDLYLAGLTSFYSSEYYDPIIIKLNSCGEKEWCRVFTKDGINFIKAIISLSDGSCVSLLRYMGSDLQTDRICLAKFLPSGNLAWYRCYNSIDTNIYNEDGYNLTITPDSGYLISGSCTYADPNPPHYWWRKPYYIKTDSMGLFEWESVIHKEITDIGGTAISSTISPDSGYIYSSISQYYHVNGTSCPSLLKMNLNGDIIGIYDVVEGFIFGQLNYATFINESELAASAGWGNSDYDLFSRAVIIDTLGNLLNSQIIMEDIYTSILQITFDNKFTYFTNTEQNGQFDAYLTKYNQNLDHDSIYTGQFTYDSLCPYSIGSDTIVQDDCGLIVGIQEPTIEANHEPELLNIYPNPASNRINCQLSIVNCQCSMLIYDLFGRILEEIIVPAGQQEIIIDVSSYPQGIYIAVLRDSKGIIARKKFVVAR